MSLRDETSNIEHGMEVGPIHDHPLPVLVRRLVQGEGCANAVVLFHQRRCTPRRRIQAIRANENRIRGGVPGSGTDVPDASTSTVKLAKSNGRIDRSAAGYLPKYVFDPS